MSDSNAKRLQVEAQTLLYKRLICREGPATTADMAEALDLKPSTIRRQCEGDIPIQLRTLAALQRLDPEGGHQLLDLIGDVMGVQWRPAEQVAPSVLEAVQAVSMAQASSSESTALACAALHDGIVTDHELGGLEVRWAQEDRKREEMRAKMRAMHREQRGSSSPSLKAVSF